MEPIWTLWKRKSRLSLRRIEPRFLGCPIRSPVHRLQYQGKRSSYAAEITGDNQFRFRRNNTNTEQIFYVRQLQKNEKGSSGTLYDQPAIHRHENILCISSNVVQSKTHLCNRRSWIHVWKAGSMRLAGVP
jgi:hypothetical protein